MFKLNNDLKLAGDQPKAVDKLLDGLSKNLKHQVLHGVTGSGKTYTMANIIAGANRPTLIISHNKTLAAQLFAEFKHFFPKDEVHYFVSYFDYYQPEAYIARSDTYIEKDSAINEQIDKYRLSATEALLTKRNVIIIASVSCIYGLGKVDDYLNLSMTFKVGESRKRDKIIRHLTDMQYHRNDNSLSRGQFRVRGHNIDIHQASEDYVYRINFDFDKIVKIERLDVYNNVALATLDKLQIFPAKHFVTPKEKLANAISKIRKELVKRVKYFEDNNKYIEAQRIKERVNFDVELLEQTGYIKGIENYSRYLTDREVGEQPATLLDYFPDDMLMFIDESHMTVPQIGGMYNGDRARKLTLVEYGFRLPSALDNRPLNFNEFNNHLNQAIYVSATPATYELEKSQQTVKQVVRPTGLLDPKIEIRSTEGQVDDLLGEIRKRTKLSQRVLVTTLTKRLAEDIANYLKNLNIKVAYLHSDIDTLERTDILQDLRAGIYDVLIGINLLREGLDLPEVSLVAILDADKEGFLRSSSALIQTIGRAARHSDGTAIMYADKITKSMQQAIDETNNRREIQIVYNKKNNIIPKTITKAAETGLRLRLAEEEIASENNENKIDFSKIKKSEKKEILKELKAEMKLASENWQFEKALLLRDQIYEIEQS